MTPSRHDSIALAHREKIDFTIPWELIYISIIQGRITSAYSLFVV